MSFENEKNRLKYRVGLSIWGKLQKKTFEDYQRAGIRAIEICPPIADSDTPYFKQMRQYANRHDVELWSYHFPMSVFESLQGFEGKGAASRKKTLQFLSEIVKEASDIGIDKFIIHPSAEPVEDAERAGIMNCSKESLAMLANVAAASGSVVAVENLPRTCLGNCSAEMLELISADDRLRVCYDTNHLLAEKSLDFMQNLADKIITLHISDYDFINERHWLPGEGAVDWVAFVDALEKINYNGVWMYEVGLKFPKTIYRDRDLTFEDFMRNAVEVQNKKAPTTFSTPKLNLGLWE